MGMSERNRACDFLNPWIARVGTVAKILQARLDRYACAAPAVPT